MRKLLPFILSAVLVVFVAAYWVLNYTGNNADLADGRTCVITVENGMTAADIANMLHKEKLIKRPESFRLEARFMGLEGKLQAGKYEIEAGKSNSEIIDILARGQLAAEGLGDAEKFKEAARNYTPYKYMETNNPDVIYKAEGFIYPSTYLFTDGMTEKDMLATMVKEFNTQINHEKIGDAAEKADMQLRDIVTIASMVELEAVFKEEQPRIAGVFLRRLQIYMPIQSDTTIQYILGAQKEEITFADTEIQNPYNTYVNAGLPADTEIQNPYNTYVNAGLPPGPIGSPSLDAIKAVLNPEQTDYLYFVADKDGHHRFTRTYDEHLQEIENIHGPQ